jgi:predicted nucleic acid-binding protein
VIFFLDTTAFSDLMREEPQTQAHVAGIGAADSVAICSVVRGEIRYGIERLPLGKRREALDAKSRRLFAAIPCEPVPPAAGDQYGQIKAALHMKGLSLDENDLWIAATAISLGATLVTRDSDFHRVDRLALANWSE